MGRHTSMAVHNLQPTSTAFRLCYLLLLHAVAMLLPYTLQGLGFRSSYLLPCQLLQPSSLLRKVTDGPPFSLEPLFLNRDVHYSLTTYGYYNGNCQHRCPSP